MTEDILTMAIQSEIRARDFFADMAGRVRNARGRRRLIGLSHDEDGHRQALERRFRALFSREFGPADGEALDPLFEFRGTDLIDQSEALEAVSVAIDAERKSISFYTEQLQSATDAEDRKLLGRLVKFEQGHRRKLQRDYDRLNRRFDWGG